MSQRPIVFVIAVLTMVIVSRPVFAGTRTTGQAAGAAREAVEFSEGLTVPGEVFAAFKCGAVDGDYVFAVAARDTFWDMSSSGPPG